MNPSRERCPGETSIAGSGLRLRATARMHEIDRQLRRIAFGRWFGTWVAAPMFVVGLLLIVRVTITSLDRLVMQGEGIVALSAVLLPFVLMLTTLPVLYLAWQGLHARERQLHSERADLAAGRPLRSAFSLHRP